MPDGLAMAADIAEPQRLDASIEASLSASNRRIVITGAGGWLGLATLELLAAALGNNLQERVACFGASYRELRLRDGTLIEQRPLSELHRLTPMPSFVLHLAFLTKDKAEGMDEVLYRAANRAISAVVLGNLDTIGATGVFVASSGAARHADDPAVSSAMRLYGTLKRQDEIDFTDWAHRHHGTAVIARIFNLSGPYINKHHAYAFAAFILDALAGRPIAVHATHRVMRGHVAIREMISLVFALLVADNAEISTFDTGGERMELAALAAAVSAAIGPVGVERATISSEHVDDYVGDGTKYDALLQRYGVRRVALHQQIRDTAEFLIASQRAGS